MAGDEFADLVEVAGGAGMVDCFVGEACLPVPGARPPVQDRNQLLARSISLSPRSTARSLDVPGPCPDAGDDLGEQVAGQDDDRGGGRLVTKVITFDQALVTPLEVDGLVALGAPLAQWDTYVHT